MTSSQKSTPEKSLKYGRPSKIPTPVRVLSAPSPSPLSSKPKPVKRRTRVSDLIARLSSSTAASRAKTSPSSIPTHNTYGITNVFRKSALDRKSSLPVVSSSTANAADGRRRSYLHVSSRSHHDRVDSSDSTVSSSFFPRMDSSSPPPPPPPPPPPNHAADQTTPKGSLSINKRYSAAGSILSVASNNSGNFGNNSSSTYLGLGLGNVSPHPATSSSAHSSRTYSTSSSSTTTTTTVTQPASRKNSERGLSHKSSTSSLKFTQAPSVAPPTLPLPSPRERSFSDDLSNNTLGTTLSSPLASPTLNRKALTANRMVSSSPHPSYRPSSRTASRPSSRLQKRPASRAASISLVNPALVRIQNNRVEELKFKVSELEEVLQREKVDRQLAASRFEQIRILEAALDRERQEKHQLELKLQQKSLRNSDYETGDDRSSEDEGQLGPTTPIAPTNPKASLDFSSSSTISDPAALAEIIGSRMGQEDAVRFDDYRRSVYSKESIDDIITGSENPNILRALVMSDEESKIIMEKGSILDRNVGALLPLQTEVSVLTSDNRALKKEVDNFVNIIRQKDEDLKTSKLDNLELAKANSELGDQVAFLQSELMTWKDKSFSTEREKMAKDIIFKDELLKSSTLEKQLKERYSEIKELKTKMDLDTVATDQVRDDLERTRTEREELQHQVMGFKTGRKQLESKVVTLEKDARRSKRLINALETSLQDLKVSLEEKAMENDELNRSILKVMERANETIEGAKRHSMVAAPSPSSTSPIDELFRRRSDIRSSISSRLSHASQFSGSSG